MTKLSKKYKIIPTKEQLAIMKDYWQRFKSVESYFYRSVGELEREMSEKTEIKDLEFFCSDGDWCGIGQGDRDMRLIQREELEK